MVLASSETCVILLLFVQKLTQITKDIWKYAIKGGLTFLVECIYLSRSIYLSICMYAYFYVYVCMHMYVWTCIDLHLSIYLSIYLSIDLSIYLSIYLSVYLSSYLVDWCRHTEWVLWVRIHREDVNLWLCLKDVDLVVVPLPEEDCRWEGHAPYIAGQLLEDAVHREERLQQV